jgi:plastocyanin
MGRSRYRSRFRARLIAGVFVIAGATTWLGADAAGVTVSQKDRAFAPATVTVKAGATLVFKNDDDVTHNSFSMSKGNEFNSKAQQPGETASVTFKTPGEVEIRCAFHPKMRMTVTVQ